MSTPPLFCYDYPAENLVLNEDDARHCFKVLRLKPGNQIHVTDGNGKLFLYDILEANPKNVSAGLVEIVSEIPPPPFIRLAVSPLKNPDRFEWLVEKATEIGVSVITPVICDNTESNRVNIPRLKRIMLSAMKQSRHYWKTGIDDLTGFKDLVEMKNKTYGFIAYCEEKPAVHLINSAGGRLPATLLIGPEGDFSKDEIKYAVDKGFELVSLGKSRLRTETAAIAGLHCLHLGNPELF